jgi:hypothetical protein
VSLLLRRFLVLAALFFWQGGFTFYASVVVPVGQDVLGHLRQGFITRQVTVYLNLAGLAALALLSWDLLAQADPQPRRRWARRSLWLVMLLTLAALFAMHGRLDEQLQRRGFLVLDPEAFRPLHRTYLWISTVQWAAAILYLILTLRLWHSADQRLQPVPAESAEEGSQEG